MQASCSEWRTEIMLHLAKCSCLCCLVTVRFYLGCYITLEIKNAYRNIHFNLQFLSHYIFPKCIHCLLVWEAFYIILLFVSAYNFNIRNLSNVRLVPGVATHEASVCFKNNLEHKFAFGHFLEYTPRTILHDVNDVTCFLHCQSPHLWSKYY